MKNKAFTLIELLAVIVIIGLLVLVTVPIVSGIIAKAETDELNVQAKYMLEAGENYFIDNFDTKAPEEPSTKSIVPLGVLVAEGYVDHINEPGSSDRCDYDNSFVEVGKGSGRKYFYAYTLVCGSVTVTDTILNEELANYAIFYDGAVVEEPEEVIEPLTVTYLIVGGGGGGGETIGGAGGAGGLITDTGLALAMSTDYSVTIGSGGAGGSGTGHPAGVKGGNSIFYLFTAIGGGAGGGFDVSSGIVGGSGGGNGGSTGIGGPHTPAQGNDGGTGTAGDNGGGGGGAGEAGTNAIQNVSGNGGDGIVSSISGSNIYYAGGGGGGTRNGNGTVGFGGLGGGGAGGITTAGSNGTNNTGGGGGGGGYVSDLAGGAGGSGVVILRYPDAYTVTVGAGLTSNTLTDGSFKVTTFTAGTDVIQFNLNP